MASPRSPRPAAAAAAPAAPAKPRVRVQCTTRPSAYMQANQPVQSPFDAASTSKRIPQVANLGPNDAARYHDRIRRLARHLARNDGWLRKAVTLLATSVVGVGPRFKPAFPELREILDAWMPEADVSGQLSFGMLLREAYRAEVVDGEVFWRLRPRDPKDGLTLPLQVELMECDQVPMDQNRSDGNRKLVNGVWTFNDRREAYMVLPWNPTDAALRGVNDDLPVPTEVSARVILHQFRPERPGARRGTSRFCSAAVKALNMSTYDMAEDTRKNLTTLITGFITRAAEEAGVPLDGEEETVDETVAAAVDKVWSDIRFEPGTLVELPEGADIKFHAPPDTGQSYEPHKRFGLAYIAACFDVLYEQLTGDWRGASDRTWRAGQVDFRKLVDEERARLEHQVLRPLYKALVDLAIALGLWVPPPGISKAKLYRFRVSWPSHKNPNQFQEYNAYGEAEDRGYIDRDSIIEELGGDPEEVDLRAAAAKARATELGLSYKGSQYGQGGPGGDLAARLVELVRQELDRAITDREQSDLDRAADPPPGDQAQAA